MSDRTVEELRAALAEAGSIEELRQLNAEVQARLAERGAVTSTMPGDGYVISRWPTRGWVHCSNIECGGHAADEQAPQREVDAIAEEHSQTFGYLTGDPTTPNANSVERSWTDLVHANEADAWCSSCGLRSMQLTDSKRPTYANRSGFDQNGLLKLLRQGLVGRVSGADASGVVVQQASPPALDTGSAEFRAAVAEAVARALG